MKYLHETYENQIYISIMHQFTPLSNVKKYPELNRKITDREYDEVIDFAIDIGLKTVLSRRGRRRRRVLFRNLTMREFEVDAFSNISYNSIVMMAIKGV